MAGDARKFNTPCRSVLICGAYGAGNLGDEAILKSIIAALRGIDPDISLCVVTREPEMTRRSYGVSAVHTFDFPGIIAATKKAELYISGGGSLIQNVTSRRSLYYYLALLRLAKRCGCKTLLYGSGIGPLSGKSDIDRTAHVLSTCVDAICLRDEMSAHLLESIGVTEPEIILSADPVFSLSACSEGEAADFLSKSGIDPEGEYACFCLRPWQGSDEHLDAIAAAISYAHTQLGLTPVFMTLNRTLDLEAAQKAARAAGVACVVLAPDSAELCMGVMKKMKLVVSMRLHGVLLAAACCLPTVGVSYDPKVAGFLSYTECGECVEFDKLTRDALTGCMKRELSRTDAAERRQRIEKIKAVESLNAQTAARLLKAKG